ncbi:alpha-mannosidase [Amnibacterium setariae]|uniref:Alpha-mannosidase n=1 Tax=Amnibacterium setariae TaxID=2306585 RepID=A0A3A1U707_9MICO|nr:alpha-mannosidase [Amnibacterium setariae]RIX30828.1 alpha-mannosidase [Amnibacterium setariae]
MSDPGALPPDEEAPLANAPQRFEPRDVPAAPRPAASPDRVVHLVGNAHLDVVWLWPWQEGYQEARATFRSVLDRMDEYPDFVFTCDQVVLLSWVEEQDPALFERIRARVAEGRWVNTGGWWVEPDCNIPTGESFVRQGLFGQRFLRSRFGRAATVGMNVDPFGHAATLPQVLAGQGMDAYCFLRPMAHELPLPSPLFRWRAPDGTAVLAFRIPFEYQSSRETVDRHIEKSLAERGERLPETMVFFGVGNHGGGPTIRQIETVHRFDRMGTFGALPLSDPERYFARVRALDPELPVVDGELQHHAPGCYSAHSGVKRWQRRAQTALLVAERWAAVAGVVLGDAVPREDLERAWKQVLFNQAHDILPGSAIEAAFEDARDQLGEAVSIAKRITAKAQNRLAATVDVPLDPATQPVLVFNPHPWPVEATVELQLGAGLEVDPQRVTTGAGERVPSQTVPPQASVGRRPGGSVAFRAALPPLGVARYALHAATGAAFAAGAVANQAEGPAASPVPAPAAPPTMLTRSGGRVVLEHDLLRVELDEGTGWLTGLLDKRTGVDLVAGARGPHLQVCEDPTDTWGHRVVSYAWPGAEMPVTRVLVREDGPLRARVRVEHAWHRSTLSEDFLLTAGDDALEVRVELDWHEPAHLLKWRVPVALDDPRGRVEIPFGSIERRVDGGEEPGQSWIDLSRVDAGLAVLNDAKHGYDLSPATEEASPSIGITAVRSPVFAWHDPTELDPEGVRSHQDLGLQRFTVRLVPHGPIDVPDLHRRAAELTMRPRAMLEGFHDGVLGDRTSWVEAGPAAVQVTAVKTAEDGDDLVVRAVETSGRATDAVIALPLVGATIRATLPAHAIRTWRVRRGAEPVPVDLLEEPLPTEA